MIVLFPFSFSYLKLHHLFEWLLYHQCPSCELIVYIVINTLKIGDYLSWFCIILIGVCIVDKFFLNNYICMYLCIQTHQHTFFCHPYTLISLSYLMPPLSSPKVISPLSLLFLFHVDALWPTNLYLNYLWGHDIEIMLLSLVGSSCGTHLRTMNVPPTSSIFISN